MDSRPRVRELLKRFVDPLEWWRTLTGNLIPTVLRVADPEAFRGSGRPLPVGPIDASVLTSSAVSSDRTWATIRRHDPGQWLLMFLTRGGPASNSMATSRCSTPATTAGSGMRRLTLGLRVPFVSRCAPPDAVSDPAALLAKPFTVRRLLPLVGSAGAGRVGATSAGPG
ncbi:hypothetical protein [Dactylosporangium matsuzakiense]|uniref:Uncharacterized protein n=1 Tax=Dactylosporangium matsuzakiense TaxID=53360 RepID=A0A9W6NJQ3_9ACTN|nr:hypothetical protein [Dactylosporangium matsuzakiense]GLK99262.1 hypothetical protein GCM10017581_010030 [Dactylosporangium matsuzakiense]